MARSALPATAKITSSVLILVSALLVCGCSPRASGPSQPVAEANSIHVDRGENGAAPTQAGSASASSSGIPRTLAFEMVGFGGAGDSATQSEKRAAATQAAIIDAFVKALIEARAGRGQTTADFSAKIGPRMTVTHRMVGAGCEVRVTLIANGIETSFVVRDGLLQHAPRDMNLVRRIFEETNGEFSLLTADRTPKGSLCTAKVACYLPFGYEPRLTGDVTGEKIDSP